MAKFGLRHPRTTAESRANETTEVKVRPKRSTLPNAWDDISVGRRGRSDRYKNHRR